MKKTTLDFSSASTTYYFGAAFDRLEKIVPKDNTFIITDDHVYAKHKRRFRGWNTIVVQAGEAHKTQQTVDGIIVQLVASGANRKSVIVGVGGGVVTDMAGYVAGIYMRGVRFGFVPTSILAMVDASIGGKNGVDVGPYKNMVGLIRQPSFLLYDYAFLKTLPRAEWINGFAEIIKHACIKDAAMFNLLEAHRLADFQKDPVLLDQLIRRNALLKSKVVQQDEFETGDRKLLNFGHTLGHAIENAYQLPHGHAVTIGMVIAAYVSRDIYNFNGAERLVALIKKYGLTAFYRFDPEKALAMMRSDKKALKNEIHYVLLQKIGRAVVKPLTPEQLAPVVQQLSTIN